ncbi:hypothetical protein [Eubacterium oxidoreducens]|uniref:hypothetical protein n=1 Tax=Eubacterium oxidoreducens TaxID=1732 RepID=UPI0015A1ADE3|nr:hypothetical protein [Eubacterium oxidoreducens]
MEISVKKLKLFSILLCIIFLLSFSLTVYAAEKPFTYNFRHELTMNGHFKAKKSSATFSIHTTTNKSSSNYFTIKQFKYHPFNNNEYVTKKTIYCKKNSDGDCSFSTKKDTSYTYEFWKVENGKYIVGSGTLKY